MRHNSKLLFLFGQNEFCADRTDAAKILNACMEYGIVYRDLTVYEDGTAHFWCTCYTSFLIKRILKKKGIKAEIIQRKGLPSLISRHRKRVGIIVGGIIASAIIAISDDYLWNIEVSGNESVTYSEVIEELSAHGLAVGMRLKGKDVDKIKTEVMIDNERIAWMAINIEGTVARVQIRERKEGENEILSQPANIVASRDGQIEYLEVFQGSATVKKGDVVRKGDILISGIRDSNNLGYMITRASGSVYAITTRTFSVEIPYEYQKKIYTNTKKNEISLIFFGKEIKVFKDSRNKGGFCDTIESVEMVSLMGRIRLPIGIHTLKTASYVLESRRYTPEEAMDIAYYRLEKQISSALPEARILNKTLNGEAGENAYILECTVVCVEDIAQVREFSVDLS